MDDAKTIIKELSYITNYFPLITFKPLHNDVQPLNYATRLSSGIDLRAYIPVDGDAIVIQPSKWAIIPTGYTCKLMSSIEGQIRSRSGLAAKHGVFVLNAPGTIDADYEGEIKVILYNAGSEPFIIHSGERIAQLVLSDIVRDSQYIDNVKHRGTDGFGSTGDVMSNICAIGPNGEVKVIFPKCDECGESLYHHIKNKTEFGGYTIIKDSVKHICNKCKKNILCDPL